MDAVIDVPIDVRGVAKHWTPTAGLHPLDLRVGAGQLVVVRGRSGSGKSTLLAVLAGWCAADAGSGVVAGAPLGTRSRRWHDVAAVPQVLALVPELTVHEQVAAARRPGQAVTEVGALLDALDLGTLAGRLPGQLSMGQQQRTAVARAAVGVPRVLLADEPTSHQGEQHGAAVVEALRSAALAGSAVVVASHDPDVAVVADLVVDLTA